MPKDLKRFTEIMFKEIFNMLDADFIFCQSRLYFNQLLSVFIWSVCLLNNIRTDERAACTER